MAKVSRTGVIDRIELDDPERLSFPVVIVLMENGSIELYGAHDGFGRLEQYIGTLANLYNSPKKQIEIAALTSIGQKIKQRIESVPVSEISFFWLKALYPSGLLRFLETEV
jgi:hypothetical protein